MFLLIYSSQNDALITIFIIPRDSGRFSCLYHGQIPSTKTILELMEMKTVKDGKHEFLTIGGATRYQMILEIYPTRWPFCLRSAFFFFNYPGHQVGILRVFYRFRRSVLER